MIPQLTLTGRGLGRRGVGRLRVGRRGFGQRGVGRRGLTGAIATLAIVPGSALAIGLPPSSAEGRQAVPKSAHTLAGTVFASLHLVEDRGSDLVEEGPVSGAISGSARGEFHVGERLTASFTLYTGTGWIKDRATATRRDSGPEEGFTGSFVAIDGRGSYLHIAGRGDLYAILDRRTDSIVVQAAGPLTY